MSNVGKTSTRPSLSLRQTHLQQICSLNVDANLGTYRMTNIICTVGPSCDSFEKLSELIQNGMNICRLNLAYADHEYHLKVLHNLREAVSKMQPVTHSQIATAIDITGPGVRIGQFKQDIKMPLKMKKGQQVVFTSDEAMAESCDLSNIFVHQSFIRKAKVDSEIFIEEGPLCFKVDETGETTLKCTVIHEGEINHHNQCHIPMTLPQNTPRLSDKDKEDIKFCVEHFVDMVFVSWVWSPDIITAVREQLGESASRVKVIAKIENYQGVKRIDEIVEAADGVLISRGDLGIDIPPEKVFLAQKMIIGRANMAGKPVICSAQMLESMITNPRPTRAEASDVANAILDGVDCVMLTKETSIGKFPGRAVQTLSQICQEAENALYHARMFRDLRSATPIPTDTVHATAIAAVEASLRSQAGAIVVVTNSGRSATLIARYRPHCVIIAITKSHHTARCLNLYRGVFVVLHTGASCDEWYMDIDMRIHNALLLAKMRGYVRTGDRAILVTGRQSGPGSTNTIRSIVVPRDQEKPHYLNIPHTKRHLGLLDSDEESMSDDDSPMQDEQESESDNGKVKIVFS